MVKLSKVCNLITLKAEINHARQMLMQLTQAHKISKTIIRKVNGLDFGAALLQQLEQVLGRCMVIEVHSRRHNEERE